MVANFWEDTSRNYERPFAAPVQAEFHRPNDEGVTATVHQVAKSWKQLNIHD